MSDQRHAVLGIHGTTEADGKVHTAHLPHRAPVLRRARLMTLAVLLVLGAGAVASFALRVSHANALAAATAEQGKVFVTTTSAKPLADKGGLVLPGTLQGMTEAPIYARSAGYVLRWHRDIGSRVAKGDLLAEIDTPDIDQQLAQAIAARDQSASSLELAKSSAERWEALRKKDAVTQQELNERSSAYTQAKANLAAADANVIRLRKLQEFKRIVAPFAGVITHRNIEVGDLVDAGNGGAGRALFTLAQVDSLRVYVYVPQAYAQKIKVGDHVSVSQKELPGKSFDGTVVRTAGAIDSATRSMQVEINLPNKENAWLAGAYVEVSLPTTHTPANLASNQDADSAGQLLTVPSNVILFRPEGSMVALVDGNGKIRLQTVSIGRDFGNALEIRSGISMQDKLVLNPPDSLADGDQVTVVQKPDEPHTDRAEKGSTAPASVNKAAS